MKRFLGIVLVVCAGWQVVADKGSAVGSSPGNGVLALGKIPAVSVSAGDSTSVLVPIKIADGYHVQANPASSEFLIPLELELQLDKQDSLISWDPVYPAPEKIRLEGTTEDLLTYHGSIEVEVLIYPSARALRGDRSFTGVLNYQACDTKRCLIPTSVPVTFDIVISERKPSN